MYPISKYSRHVSSHWEHFQCANMQCTIDQSNFIVLINGKQMEIVNLEDANRVKYTFKENVLGMRVLEGQLSSPKKIRFQIRFCTIDDLNSVLGELKKLIYHGSADSGVSMEASQLAAFDSQPAPSYPLIPTFRRSEPGNIASVSSVSSSMAKNATLYPSLPDQLLIPDMDTDEGLDMWIDRVLADPDFPEFVERVEKMWAKKFLSDIL